MSIKPKAFEAVVQNLSGKELLDFMQIIQTEANKRTKKCSVLLNEIYEQYPCKHILSQLGEDILKIVNSTDNRTHPALIMAFGRFDQMLNGNPEAFMFCEPVDVPVEKTIDIDSVRVNYSNVEFVSIIGGHFVESTITPEELVVLEDFFAKVPSLYNENGQLYKS